MKPNSENSLISKLKLDTSPDLTIAAIFDYYKHEFGSLWFDRVFSARVDEVLKVLSDSIRKDGESNSLVADLDSLNAQEERVLKAAKIQSQIMQSLSNNGEIDHFSLMAARAAHRVFMLDSIDIRKEFFENYLFLLIEDLFMRHIATLIGHPGVINPLALERRLEAIKVHIQNTNIKL